MAYRLVGRQAPRFEMQAVMPNKKIGKVSIEENMRKDKWTVLVFYPNDFTFVCPTEITSLSDRYGEFADLDAEIIGVSTDSVFTHLAWVNTSRENNGLGDIHFPLASDKSMQASKRYGVLIEDEGIALRGLFIISPEGELLYSVITDNNIGRNVDETLRVLQALQTGSLCPVNWKPGQKTL